MKNIKKIAALLLALSIMLCAFSLTACNTDGAQENTAGSVTLVVKGAEEKSYTVSLDGISLDKGLVSILDALKAVALPTVEVHLTDISTREEFRRFSYISLYAQKTICGKGFDGYKEGLHYLSQL